MKEIERELLKLSRDLLAKDANYIFVVKNEDDEYILGVSVHKNPKLGFQELRGHMAKNDARRLLRQLSNKWKDAEILQFESKGAGHRKRYRKKKLLVAGVLLKIAEELISVGKGK